MSSKAGEVGSVEAQHELQLYQSRFKLLLQRVDEQIAHFEADKAKWKTCRHCGVADPTVLSCGGGNWTDAHHRTYLQCIAAVVRTLLGGQR